MPDEFPMHDPQRIWQGQPTEAMKMSLDEIRRRARKLQTRGRLAALSTIVIGLVLCVLFALTAARPQELLGRIGWAILSLWGSYAAYQAYKWTWPGTLAADATLSTSLDFYRRELERKHDYARHVWRRAGLTFCFAGLALVVLPALIGAFRTPRLLLNVAPLLVLLVIWLVVFFSLRRRNRRKLQREIDELKLLEE
jgi:polyferredoxin